MILLSVYLALFQSDIGKVIDNGNRVIEEPVIDVDGIQNYIYTLKSTLNEYEWNNLLRPLVHPFGWYDIYINVNYSVISTDMIQTKVINIHNVIDYANLSYYHNNPTLDGYGLNLTLGELRNINILDLHKNSKINYAVSIME